MDWKKYEPFIDKSGHFAPAVAVEMNELFRREALHSSGLWGHPMADELWSRAWKAHEFGVKEVYEHLDMLADTVLSPVGQILN